MAFIRWFQELSKDDVPIAGGKGANLGEMTRAGFPIPPGFVITADAYWHFVNSTGIKDKIFEILRNTNLDDPQALWNASQEIQKLFLEHEIPEDLKNEILQNYHGLSNMFGEHESFVAVRSSATAEDLPDASFAGQQATFLNVKGEQEVLEAVKKCWASLWTARAIHYRTEMGFDHEKVALAVVVQKQIHSKKSGVMFTADPVSNDTSKIVIEASWGLGESIVSGEVTPDTYIVDKSSLKILEKHINEKRIMTVYDYEKRENVKVPVPDDMKNTQCLTDEEIVRLAEIGRKIEEHYRHPQDIEWAIDDTGMYIVQARNITTLDKGKKEEEAIVKDAKVLVKGIPASPGVGSGKVKIILGPEDFGKFEKGDVLVTTMTNPDMEPLMAKASAIVTDEGGLTSHAAIVARELGVPCVVGTGNATKVLKEGMLVTVDATHGVVYEGKVAMEEEKKEEREIIAVPHEITATKVMIIASHPSVAKKYKNKVDGIGLLRLEFLVAQTGKHPRWYLENNKLDEFSEVLAEKLEEILRIMYPKPVIVRTLDMRTDEYRNLEGGDKEPKEANPMIGWHGIRRDLDQPEIFRAQIRAFKKLIKEKKLNNLWIMLPFIISPEELEMAKCIMIEEGLIPHRDVKLGIMVETPAAALTIEDFIDVGIDFISFGTNDLTQLTLGIDRNNELIQNRFDEMHPAVLSLIERVIRACKEAGVYTSICGQAGSRPEMAEFLVNLGIDSVSVNPDAIDLVRETIARTEKQLLLESARKSLFGEQE